MCDGSPALRELRATLWSALRTAHPDLSRALLAMEPVEMVQLLTVHDGALPTFARYVRECTGGLQRNSYVSSLVPELGTFCF
ncbi:hypothetical protein EXIGLDRAFT_528693 [Exidia glandulosa HHB12029]|uniref:Uncharacterized protein n=1 Tax=Exidia glandulosa HHB12029 TaxID=1314781 RepID=A0A166MWX7_EXIGL|nr:hypothetical protein EXIGLDRAFT_528693 [Exidia glandulosa HHB12029]